MSKDKYSTGFVSQSLALQQGTFRSIGQPRPRVLRHHGPPIDPVAGYIPVLCAMDGGAAGGDKTDCSYTYTIATLNGVELANTKTPANYYTRLLGVKYVAATQGLAVQINGVYDFYPLDEYSAYEQLFLNPYEIAGYRVNLDAKNGYVEITSPDEIRQISLDMHNAAPLLTIFDSTTKVDIDLNDTKQYVQATNGAIVATLQVASDSPKIAITDGTATAAMHIDTRIISIADGAGTYIELDGSNGSLNTFNAAATTINVALADLVAATTAKFQDITYVSDVFWDAGTLTLKQTKKTVRVLCVKPAAGTDSDILTGAKYPQTGTCE